MRMSGDGAAGSSPLVLFGDELRHWRLAAGLSQEQLGERIGYSAAQVGAVETARRMPSDDFARRADEALGTAGALVRLLGRLKKFLRNQAYPAWFRGWPNVEREAATLRSWEPMVVPGLLQTEDYARAILGVQPGTSEERLEELVGARLERQAVLAGEEPPFLWCLLDEGVLHRRMGSPKIMNDQLGHLVKMSERPQVTVQVVPHSVGAHPGTAGPFVIAGFGDAPSTVYLDTAVTGQIVETQGMVDQVTLVWEALRSEALPRAASRDLIAKIAEERWT
jgi:transcriptional regulator with XRE-family HTH domain